MRLSKWIPYIFEKGPHGFHPVKKIRNSPIFHHETRKSFSFADLDGGEESPSKPIVNSSPIKNLVKLTPMPDYEEMLSPDQSAKYRGILARGNNLGQGRTDNNMR